MGKLIWTVAAWMPSCWKASSDAATARSRPGWISPVPTWPLAARSSPLKTPGAFVPSRRERGAASNRVSCASSSAYTPANSRGTAGAAPAVPREFAGVYAELDAQLTRFDAAPRSRRDGTKAPGVFSGELLAANGHVGTGLIQPGRDRAVAASLDAFQQLGIQAATVQIS